MDDIGTLLQLYEERRLDAAWTEYMRLMGVGPVSAEGHLLGALIVRLRGDLRTSRTILERCELAGPTVDTLGRFRLLMGNVLREIGDISTAVDYYEAFVEGIDLYPGTRAVCLGAAWYNLGLARRTQRRLPDAVRCYELACEEFRMYDFPDYLRQALQNISWTECLMGNLERAAEALMEAESLCKTEVAKLHQEIGVALWESLTGAPHSAMVTCERLIEQSASIPPALVSQAFWLAGRVALQLGQMDQADIMAQQAVSWSLQVRDDLRPMQDANSLRSEIHKARVQKQATGA